MTSQTTRVLDYMKTFGSITPLQAFADLGCMRLGARIWDLKKAGHNIITETEESKNRFGHTVRYAKYSLGAESWQKGIETIGMPDNLAERVG